MATYEGKSMGQLYYLITLGVACLSSIAAVSTVRFLLPTVRFTDHTGAALRTQKSEEKLTFHQHVTCVSVVLPTVF